MAPPRKRTQAADCERFDVATTWRQKLDAAVPRGSLVAERQQDQLVLSREGFQWYIALVPRPMGPWGRGRQIALCPTCGARRQILYRPRKATEWGCAKCLHLAYESQSASAYDRAWHRERRLKAQRDRWAPGSRKRALLESRIREAEYLRRRLWLSDVAVLVRDTDPGFAARIRDLLEG